jgi:Tol biopolymer transport system component
MKFQFSQSRIGKNILNALVCVGLLSILFGCKPYKAPQKPLSLGQYSEISSVSISPDGNQILFEGCGHKEYPSCTIYRFDWTNNRLFRYLPRNPNELLYGGRYSPSSSRIVLSIIPLNADESRNYEDSQIALMQQDGSGLQIVSAGKGLKTEPVLSNDEKQLAFFKSEMSSVGSPLRKQRTRAIRYDLYNLNLLTGKESRLTKYEFYSAGNAYFTSDNKKILFEGDSPMSSDYLDKDKNLSIFEKKENIVFTRSIDGTDVNKGLTPYFTYSHGSKMPVLFKDGSLVFEGREGIQNFIHYYKRSPDGSLDNITYEELGEGKGEDGRSLIVVRAMTGTPDGRLLAILNYNQDTKQHYIRVLDLATRKLTDIVPPTIIENITIR